MKSKSKKPYKLFIHEVPVLPDLIKLSHLPRIECTDSIINFELKYNTFDNNRTTKNRDAALEASKILYGENGVLTPDCRSYFKREKDGINNFRYKMETLRDHSHSRSSNEGGKRKYRSRRQSRRRSRRQSRRQSRRRSARVTSYRRH
jgi:hypothetical protein